MKIWMANINPVIGGDPRMGEGDSGKAQTSGESPQKNAQTLCESSRGGDVDDERNHALAKTLEDMSIVSFGSSGNFFVHFGSSP